MRFLMIMLVAFAPLASAQRGPVTFERVLPILVKNCQGCHGMGRLAPMPFTTYEETRPWAAAIRAAVASKKMPPSLSESHPGLFGEDGRLSPADVETIVRWVDEGAVEGNGTNAKNRKRER